MHTFLFKISSIIILSLTINHLVFSQNTHWETINLNDSATVEFPGRAVKKEVQGQEAFVFKDEKALYLIVVQNDAYSGNPIDSELNKFYEGALNGTLESGGGGQIVAKKIFSVNGFRGIEAQYTTPNKSSLPKIKYVRLVLANRIFYSENFWTDVEQDPDLINNKNHFFSSFRLSVKKTSPVNPETQTQAYKLGSLMGRLFFYGALVAVFVAIVRRVKKPKRQV